MYDGSAPIVFTLPPRLRPATNVYVPVDLLYGRPGRLSVDPDGTAIVFAANSFTDATTFTSLEGVTFDAGD